MFSVDLIAPDAVDKMKHWIAKGLTGMRLYTAGTSLPEQTVWFADPKTFPAWSFAGEAGLPVCMQMRAKGFPQLTPMLERFPNVRFIIDHLARTEMADGPPYAAAAPLFALARYPNVFLKVTHRNFEEARNGRATPETFFARLVDGIRRQPHRLGIELSRRQADAAGARRARPRVARLPAGAGS